MRFFLGVSLLALPRPHAPQGRENIMMFSLLSVYPRMVECWTLSSQNWTDEDWHQFMGHVYAQPGEGGHSVKQGHMEAACGMEWTARVDEWQVL